MIRIMIVDDEHFIVNYMASLLEEKTSVETDIYKAYSGVDALAIFAQVKIDLVLLDIHMPGVSGLEIADKIAENWSECRILFLTAYDNFNNWNSAFHYLESLSSHLFSLTELKKSDKNEWIIEKIKSYIEENSSEKLTLSNISETVNYNETYVSRLFKQMTGSGLSEYINRIRIQKAKDLLKTTNESIQSIAASTGFDTSQYFSMVFRKIVGVSPSDYRR